MEYRLVRGRFKKGQFYLCQDNNKINPNVTVESEINHLLSKGWRLCGNPNMSDYYGIIYHLVREDSQ